MLALGNHVKCLLFEHRRVEVPRVHVYLDSALFTHYVHGYIFPFWNIIELVLFLQKCVNMSKSTLDQRLFPIHKYCYQYKKHSP